VISPRQTELVCDRLTGIHDWLGHGHEDWVPDDEEEPS